MIRALVEENLRLKEEILFLRIQTGNETNTTAEQALQFCQKFIFPEVSPYSEEPRGAKLFIGGRGYNGYNGDLATGEVFGGNKTCNTSLPIADDDMSFTDGYMSSLMCGIGDGDKDCFIYDKETMTVRHHSRTQKNRQASLMVNISTGYLIMGGFPGSEKSTEFLPFGETSWTEGPTEIPGRGVRYSCHVTLPDNKIVIIGGSLDSRQIRQYDTKTHEWSQWDSFPYGLGYHDCIMTDIGILVTGGYTDTYDITGKTFIIDMDGKQTQVGTMNVPRHGHRLVKIDGFVYAVGGRDGRDVALSSIEKFVNGTWVMSSYELIEARDGFAVLDIPSTDKC